jgi:hypothetical protein
VNPLEAALAGRPVDRPLLAPLFAALAAEVEELDVRAFLADPGRRARIYADLARALRVDVLVADSGSGWDAEAAGFALDWSAGYPPAIGARGGAATGAAAMGDLLRRVRAVVAEPTVLGVTVTGPATLAAAAGLELAATAQLTLAAARCAAEAGAGVVFVREIVPEPPAGYARAVMPLWGSLKFFRAVGVLKARWAADVRGPFLPCVTTPPASGPYALAVAPGEAAPPNQAALITHTEDLAGHVPVRELQSAAARLG